MDEPVKVGTAWCEDCRKEYDVFVSGEGVESGRAPQIYIHGFHIHLCSQIVELPPMCIWVTNPNTFVEQIESCTKALSDLKGGK